MLFWRMVYGSPFALSGVSWVSRRASSDCDPAFLMARSRALRDFMKAIYTQYGVRLQVFSYSAFCLKASGGVIDFRCL